MKFLIRSFLVMFMASPLVHATEANGLVQEVRICGTGKTTWVRYLAFQVEDKWFGTYADYAGSSLDHDNNLHTSAVMMAFSAKLPVQIVANGAWNSEFISCGIPTGAMIHRGSGEFLSIKR